jgi:hypothetical protein
MLKGFIMPEKARITKVIINGVERLIDPPIEIDAGEVIHIPYESAQQSPAGHPTGLTAAQKEEVRQMIQSALDTGST